MSRRFLLIGKMGLVDIPSDYIGYIPPAIAWPPTLLPATSEIDQIRGSLSYHPEVPLHSGQRIDRNLSPTHFSIVYIKYTAHSTEVCLPGEL